MLEGMEMSKADGDRIAAELVAQTLEWFDADNAKPMVNACVKMSRKLIDSLLTDNLKEVKAKDKTQMLAYVGKTLDQVARFIQFSAGKPDSRAEVTVAALLPLLTEEELAIFNRALTRLESAPTVATGVKPQSELH